jgi:hypothetical protein
VDDDWTAATTQHALLDVLHVGLPRPGQTRALLSFSLTPFGFTWRIPVLVGAKNNSMWGRMILHPAGSVGLTVSASFRLGTLRVRISSQDPGPLLGQLAAHAPALRALFVQVKACGRSAALHHKCIHFIPDSPNFILDSPRDSAVMSLKRRDRTVRPGRRGAPRPRSARSVT